MGELLGGVNPLSNAFNALESVTGGHAGPSNATGGYHDSSIALNAGVNMGNGPNPWLIGSVVLIAAVAYAYTHK
ncbi:hypothetical protein ABF162_07480 [Vibrio coralliilyticus]|uniref:hypothetical protein n=1 Tax=Vibrio coralliilyticus TaxID=190893 RepID=UPI00052B03C9|nr:hypothetical protein [Vibrio coralliilyticus]AIU66865.1 hypothetical protein JV59_31465 [Vibrio coralliilyticus]